MGLVVESFVPNMNWMLEGLGMLESWVLGLGIYGASVVITDMAGDGFYDNWRCFKVAKQWCYNDR